MSDWLLEAALTEAWMIHVGGYVRTGRMVRPYLRAPRGAAVPHLAVVGRPIDTHALQVGDVLIDDTHRQWRVHALQPAYAYDLNRSALVGVSPVGGGRVVNRRLSKFTKMAPGVPGWEAPKLDYTPKTLREWADIGGTMAEEVLQEFDPDQPRMPAGREGGGRWVKKARLGMPLFHVSPEFHRDNIHADGLMPPERVPGAAGGLQGDHGDDRPDHIALVRDPDAVYFHAKRGVSENYAQWRERDGRERRRFSTYGAYPNTRQDLWQAAGVPLDSLAPDHETFADLVLSDFFAAKESGDVWDLDNEYRNISAGADTLGTFLRYRGMELLTARGMWPMTGSRYSRNDNEMYNRVRDEREAAIMLLHEMPPDLRTALALRWAEEGMGVMVYGGVPKSRVRRVERMYEAVWIAERMLEQR